MTTLPLFLMSSSKFFMANGARLVFSLNGYSRYGGMFLKRDCSCGIVSLWAGPPLKFSFITGDCGAVYSMLPD